MAGMRLRRRKRQPARTVDSVRRKVRRSGPAKTVQGAGMAGRAGGRSGKAMAVYAGRKASGKRAPLLASLPILAGASIAGFFAVRKMRRGVKQTVPD
jgi:hypothetical protein